MPRLGNAQFTLIVLTMSALATLRSSTSARLAAPDCTKIDAGAAAKVLGVTATRNTTSGPHHKQPPDNMDVLGRGYAEVSADPLAKTLTYFIYAPIPKDLESVFESLSHEHVPGAVTRFSPGLGVGSTGWSRPSANGETFDGSVLVRGSGYIAVAKVAGMPSIATVQSALKSAGQLLAAP